MQYKERWDDTGLLDVFYTIGYGWNWLACGIPLVLMWCGEGGVILFGLCYLFLQTLMGMATVGLAIWLMFAWPWQYTFAISLGYTVFAILCNAFQKEIL